MAMKRATPLEVAVCASLLLIGLYMVYKGTADQSAGLMIGGAVSSALGVIALVTAVRALRWHRQMLRESAQNQEPSKIHSHTASTPRATLEERKTLTR